MKSVKEKPQTPNQRVTNPVWLRGQIQRLIERCAADITEDLKMAGQTSGDVSDRYRASVTSTRHWKQQLERILAGKTPAEEVAENLERHPRRVARKAGSP